MEGHSEGATAISWRTSGTAPHEVGHESERRGNGGGDGCDGGAGLDASRHSDRAGSSRSLNSSSLTVLEGRPLMVSGVAKHSRDVVTWPGPKFGRSARICAATPATCGHAMLVPEIVVVSESEPIHAAVMAEPGAWMSTHVPWFEKPDLASLLVVDPTVTASGVEAGE